MGDPNRVSNPAAMAGNISFASATDLLSGLRRGDISSVELLEHYIRRITQHNGALNAVVTLDGERALEAARAADGARAKGVNLGPLHGLPITVKDSWETAGLRTTCGDARLEKHVPKTDADAITRLRQSGAVIMGKTNLPTGNQDIQTTNVLFGTTNNPWNVLRTPGGSAGGGAAATAAGLTAFDFASEIGGSTRIPAHFCGLYGHKTTFGSVPLGTSE